MRCNSGEWATITLGIMHTVLTIVQIEQEARHVFVIDPPTSICLVLGDQLLMHTNTRMTLYMKPEDHRQNLCIGLHCMNLPLHSILR